MTNIFLLLILCIFILPVQSQTQSQINIFGLHDVIDQKYLDIYHRPVYSSDYYQDDLQKFIETALASDYKFITVSDMVRLIKAHDPKMFSQKYIILTFDDGYLGIYNNLLPLLKKYNIPVTLFISTELLSEQDANLKYLTCADLKELSKTKLFDIQSHGYRHINLTQLSQEDLWKELILAKYSLARCLGTSPHDIRHFAYPYGKNNTQTKEFIELLYDSAYLYDGKSLDILDKQDLYLLDRRFVNLKTRPLDLLGKQN